MAKGSGGEAWHPVGATARGPPRTGWATRASGSGLSHVPCSPARRTLSAEPAWPPSTTPRGSVALPPKVAPGSVATPQHDVWPASQRLTPPAPGPLLLGTVTMGCGAQGHGAPHGRAHL